VKHKKIYGETIGLPVIVFGQNHVAAHAKDGVQYDRTQANNFDDVGIYVNQKYDSIGKLMELIKYLNYDKECVGIIVQLPLPAQFQQYKEQILAAITPEKDVDGL
jgi:5,10-methylene-tetrahydrofolate dehydrogenase/methenyl tetrahydrofolate cyclohydrolase